jgi:hypothetical protein
MSSWIAAVDETAKPSNVKKLTRLIEESHNRVKDKIDVTEIPGMRVTQVAETVTICEPERMRRQWRLDVRRRRDGASGRVRPPWLPLPVSHHGNGSGGGY